MAAASTDSMIASLHLFPLPLPLPLALTHAFAETLTVDVRKFDVVDEQVKATGEAMET